MKKEYPTNLTDNQWQILQKILEPSTRKRKYSLRDIMNCILYVNKTGCQWRMTPKEFPPHNIVFYYFTKWKREGVFEDIMNTLREKLRKILADGGYMGEELKELVRKTLGCNLEVVLRPNESHKSSMSSL